MKAFIWIVTSLSFSIGVVAFAVHHSWIRIPPNWLPWEAVELEQPPSWFARLQINSLSTDRRACFDALARSSMIFRAIDDRPADDGCGIESGAVIKRSYVPYNRPFEATCALLAALYWYEQRIDALARQHLGTPLALIDQWGTYACRNVNRSEAGRRSQHATANAIDIAAFSFADGSSITVLDHWGEDTPEGRFLTATRDAGCQFFNTVLGPDYNDLHSNHFHLDLGRARICR